MLIQGLDTIEGAGMMDKGSVSVKAMSGAAIPVARLMSGAAIPVELLSTATQTLGTPITVGETRQRIANSFGVPVGRIRLLGPMAHAPLDDHTTIGLEVRVVVLTLDPDAERRAEAAFLSACGAAHMESLLPSSKLDVQDKELTCLPESIGQLTLLQDLHLAGNQLSSLPESIGQLTALQYLDLGYNWCSSVSEKMANSPRCCRICGFQETSSTASLRPLADSLRYSIWTLDATC